MPIDKNGIIYNSKPPQKKHVSLKDICLIITTCIAIFTSILSYNEIKIDRLNYERQMEELELELEKYKNILKENDIQVRSSYIECNVNYVSDLFDSLGKEGNVKILKNDLTKVFYDADKKIYMEGKEIQQKNSELKEQYKYVYVNVIFLRIEVISNRRAENVRVDFGVIEENENIHTHVIKFADIKEDHNASENLTVAVGDTAPNDVILIPVMIKYTEGGIMDDLAYIVPECFMIEDKESIHKKIYIPEKIVLYDNFYEKEISFEIRDMLEDSLITEFYYEELG